MPMFTVNTHRIDPYSNFKFRVSWDTQPVAGLSKMSALKKSTEVTEWRAAANNSQGDAAASPVNYRKEVIIQVLNLQGTPAMQFKLSRAWVSEFQALPEM